ncbi:kelch domain-containing protein [Paraphaeosphaeria sporulosa]
MAELAAGAGIALAAEEVLSTSFQAGVATYFLVKPTQPLNATFTRIAVVHDDEMHKRSLTRSNHTLTIVDSKAYIYGGETADATVATNDMHVVNLEPGANHEPDYQLIPAIPQEEDGRIPRGRTNHAACAFQEGVVVYGGTSSTGQPADDGDVWLFTPSSKTWSILHSFATDGPVLHPSTETRIFPLNNTSLLLLIGDSTDGITTIARLTPSLSADADPASAPSPYETLVPPPSPTSPSNATVHNNTLYLISSTNPVSSQLHVLPLDTKDAKWTTLTFPTNPLVPGPRARYAGALLPLTTGYGRNYLVYLLGARSEPSPRTSKPTDGFTEQDLSSHSTTEKEPVPEPTQWSDTWTLQLPSSNLAPQATLSMKDAIKPAKLKDAIRTGVGAESGKWTWCDVDVRVPDDLGDAGAGKLHPGPRTFFGADVMKDGRSVLFWGGEIAEGEKVGDGWVVRLE